MHSLKLARVRAGMTLTELAEKSGVTPNTISQIERGGRVPQATTLYKLALALRVDAAVLVEREKATAQKKRPSPDSPAKSPTPNRSKEDVGT